MDFIYKIKEAYPKISCKKIIKWFEDNKNLSYNGSGSNNVSSNALEITIVVEKESDYFNLGKSLYQSIDKFKKKYPYVDKHLGAWTLDNKIQLMKYKPNDCYNTIHCENDGFKKHLKRVFAFMIYLNDIKKGGGTRFMFQKKTIKAKAGDFYMWPASWTHFHKGVNAPNETKYILTGWVSYI